MSIKKIFLLVTLFIFSAILGFSLGNLNLFAFLDGNYSPLLILLISITLSYLTAVVVFVLEFSNRTRINLAYTASSILFSLFFLIANRFLITSLLVFFCYLGFLFYVEYFGERRSHLFVKFKSREIFTPVVKQAFAFLMLIFAILGFFNTRNLMPEGKVSPQLVNLVSKPIVTIVNEQLGKQLQTQLGSQFQQSIGTNEREEIVIFVLEETIEAMAEGQTRQVFGFTPENIPIDKTIVYPNGEIDLTPVINEMAPDIAEKINQTYGNLVIFVPVIIAVLVILLLQPLLFPFHLLSGFILTPVLFYLMKISGFIIITKETVEAERVSI